jgi:O-antigen/teichoic acid export membrane protein
MLLIYNNKAIIKRIIGSKVIRNFSYLTLSSLLSQAIGIFTIIRITRLFSPYNYGVYTFIMSQGALLFTVGDLGITSIVIRTIARDNLRTNDILFNGAIIRFFSVLLLTILYISYNYFFGSLTSEQILLVFLFALISCFARLIEIAFWGNQQMLPSSIISLSYSVAWFSIVTLFPDNYLNVTSLFYAYLILNTLKAIISFSVLKFRKLLVGKIRNFWISSKELLKESWPYFILVLLMTPVNYLPNNFLESNSNVVEIAYFSISQKLLLPVDLILGFLLSAIFPNLSALWAENERRFYQLVSVGFKYFMLAALVLCFLFTLFARELITLIFKPGYLPAVPVCQLQVWYIYLMAVNSLTGTILGAVNKEKLVLKTGIISALIYTPMLYYGSKYGALGLSYGYVVAFIIAMIPIWYIFKTAIKIEIECDLLMWALTILLFTASYFLLQNTSIIYRIILALLITGGATLYFFKTSKSILIK